MSEEFTLKYDLSMDDILAWNEYHYSNSPVMKQQRFAFTWGVVSILVALVALNYSRDHNTINLIIGLIVAAAYVAYVSLRRKAWIKNSAKKFYSEGKNKGTIGKQTLRLMDDGILETTEVGEAKIYWSGIEKIVETPDYAFIYIGALNAFVIPKNKVEEGNFRAFIDELQRRLESQNQ